LKHKEDTNTKGLKHSVLNNVLIYFRFKGGK